METGSWMLQFKIFHFSRGLFKVGNSACVAVEVPDRKDFFHRVSSGSIFRSVSGWTLNIRHVRVLVGVGDAWEDLPG